MKQLISKWMGLALLVAQSSWAATGTERGNGGDVVVLPDDRVVLADEYIQRAGDRWSLPPQLVEELNRIQFIIERYAGAGTFIDSEVFHPYVEFRVVDSIPIECSRIPLTGQPSGSRTVNAGCSIERRTYLVRDLIKRMSIRELAKLVFHERVRAARPEISAEAIYDLSVGIETALNLHNDQLNHQFASSALSHQSYSALNALRLRLYSDLLNGTRPLNEYQSWAIWKNGGGLVEQKMLKVIDHTAIVTLSASVAYNGSIGANSIIQGSHLRGAVIGKNSVVERSKMDDSLIENQISLIDSEIHAAIYAAPGAHVSIQSSKVNAGGGVVFKGSAELDRVDLTALHAVIGAGAKIKSSSITADEIRIGNENTLDGFVLMNQSYLPSFPLGFKTGDGAQLSGRFPVQAVGQWLKRDRKTLMPAALGLAGLGTFAFQMASGRNYYPSFGVFMAAIFWGLDADSGGSDPARTYKTRANSDDRTLNELMREKRGLLLELGAGFSSTLSSQESVCAEDKTIRLKKYVQANDLKVLRDLCRKEK